MAYNNLISKKKVRQPKEKKIFKPEEKKNTNTQQKSLEPLWLKIRLSDLMQIPECKNKKQK